MKRCIGVLITLLLCSTLSIGQGRLRTAEAIAENGLDDEAQLVFGDYDSSSSWSFWSGDDEDNLRMLNEHEDEDYDASWQQKRELMLGRNRSPKRREMMMLRNAGYPKMNEFFQNKMDMLDSNVPHPKDLGIRFNKVGEVVGATAVPLGPADYPITVETAEWLRKSECWSVLTEEDCPPEDCPYDINDLIKSIGGLPSHPLNDTTAPFWTEFREVVQVQKMRRAGNIAPGDVMSMPDIWDGYNMEAVAEAVHNEYPGENQARVIEMFIEADVEMDREIIPINSRVQFLRKMVLLGHINTFVIAAVGPQNFQTKFYGGRARPEEVAFKIATGEIGVNDGVPADIVDDILAMNLEHPFNFTAYPEGSPHHPSWPAMHSAASSASLWLPLVMDLSERQMCEVQRVDYAVSYGRTVAGVHYMADNIAGLNLGQEIVARKLPRYLRYFYGSDIRKVYAKIRRLRFDWRNFTETECYKNPAFASITE